MAVGKVTPPHYLKIVFTPFTWGVWETQNCSKCSLAKSQRTGIRLRKVVSGPTPHLP